MNNREMPIREMPIKELQELNFNSRDITYKEMAQIVADISVRPQYKFKINFSKCVMMD